MTATDILSRAIAGSLLVTVSPVLAVCAIIILIEDGGPVLFRQQRIGQAGKPFNLLKLRSMRLRAAGQKITADGDSRITASGHILRHYKLDEVPQLWNVLCGHMNFIGPRPEVPEYVDLSDQRWQTVLSVRPGITDLASLVFINEQTLLSQQHDIESFYRNWLLPRKLDLSTYYIHNRTFLMDLRLLTQTIKDSLFPKHYQPNHITDRFKYGGRI